MIPQPGFACHRGYRGVLGFTGAATIAPMARANRRVPAAAAAGTRGRRAHPAVEPRRARRTTQGESLDGRALISGSATVHPLRWSYSTSTSRVAFSRQQGYALASSCTVVT